MKRSCVFSGGAFIFGLLFVSVAYASDKAISFSYNSDWPPYSSGIGENVQGILPTLIDEIVGNRMDMSVTHYGSPWARAQHYVESGQYDAMITVPTEKRKSYARTTEQIVYTFKMRPIVKSGSETEKLLATAPSVNALRTLRICDLIENGWAKHFYSTHDIDYYAAADTASCLRLITSDRMDVMIQPAAIGFKSIAEEHMQAEVATLDHVFGFMKFNILLSNNSKLEDGFLKLFDATVREMIADGSYDTLINNLQSGVLIGE